MQGRWMLAWALAWAFAGCGSAPAFEYTAIDLESPSAGSCVVTFNVVGEAFSVLEIECYGESCTCTLDGEVATFFNDLELCEEAGAQLDKDPDALTIAVAEDCGGADLFSTE
ncbi:MAG TPA: hypothetical protein ENK18_10365 [Deltaproteobacteria bacterium]|nr:hypothetical protein [Deltaproteobacteria bacterium]